MPRSRSLALAVAACASAAGLSFAIAGARPVARPTTVALRATKPKEMPKDKYGRVMDTDDPVAYMTAEERANAPPPNDGGNQGGVQWSHPWCDELSKSDKGDDMTFEDVVEFFQAKREEEGLMPLDEVGTTMVILEGIVSNAENAGQGANKAERVAHGISTSAWLMSELTD